MDALAICQQSEDCFSDIGIEMNGINHVHVVERIHDIFQSQTQIFERLSPIFTAVRGDQNQARRVEGLHRKVTLKRAAAALGG